MYLTRRNTVLESLRANRRQSKMLYIQQGLPKKQAAPLMEAANRVGVPIKQVDKGKLGNMTQSGDHQGVALDAGPYPYAEIDQMLDLAAQRNEPPLILIFDLIQGVYNVGTLLRTAEIVGVHGVIMQDRRAPEISTQIVQHSQGAAEHLLIAKETNLVKSLERLKAEDIWIGGLDFGDDAVMLGQFDLNRPLGLVVGHEGDGMRRLVRGACDFILKLPQRGQVESLNAAVAGSVALYAAWQARGFN